MKLQLRIHCHLLASCCKYKNKGASKSSLNSKLIQIHNLKLHFCSSSATGGSLSRWSRAKLDQPWTLCSSKNHNAVTFPRNSILDLSDFSTTVSALGSENVPVHFKCTKWPHFILDLCELQPAAKEKTTIYSLRVGN